MDEVLAETELINFMKNLMVPSRKNSHFKSMSSPLDWVEARM